MEDTYRGESPAKKYARFLCWSHISEGLGNKFAEGKHLVLASREAGDISALLGLGVNPKGIIAVEHSSSAAHAAQEKYPQVHVVCRDVVKIARECKRTLSSAYLDFCGTLTDAMISKVCQVALLGLKDDAYLAVTMLAGREQGELRDEVLFEKARTLERRRFFSLSDKQLVTEMISGIRGRASEDRAYKERLQEALLVEGDTKLAAENIRRTQTELYLEHSTYLARMHYLHRALLDRLLPHRVAVHPVEVLHYNSHTRESNGMPMCVSIFKTRRFLRSMPERKFKAYSNRFGTEEGQTRVRDCNLDERELRRAALSMLDTMDLRPAHLGNCSSTETLAQVLNLPKETIIAWKAHRTRGTYGQESQ